MTLQTLPAPAAAKLRQAIARRDSAGIRAVWLGLWMHEHDACRGFGFCALGVEGCPAPPTEEAEHGD